MRSLLSQFGTEHKLVAGSELHFLRGDESRACYLLSGCLTLSHGNRIMDVCWPGDLFDSHSGNSGVARAATESVVVTVPERPLLSRMAESQELTAWVWRQQRQRIARLQQRVRFLSRHSVERRILQTVIELDQQAAVSPDRLIPLSQREVADLAGVTREATSTILNRLHKAGLVRLGRRKLTVAAPDQLRDLVNSLFTAAA